MAWSDGIFLRFLKYWTRPRERKEKNPYFWEDVMQKADAEKKGQVTQNGKEIERIFYISQEKANIPKEEKRMDVSVFQRQVLPVEKRERIHDKPIFLQKDKESISAQAKEKQKQKSAEGILQKENVWTETQKKPLQKEDVFSFFPKEREKKTQKERDVFRQAERQISETGKDSLIKKGKSVFLKREEEKTAEKKEKGISPIIQEMTREYRTEELLQQIVQYAGQKAEMGTEQKISVQIGQVQKSADVDTIIAEMTKKLWEARSVGRCSVERR